MLKIYSRIEKIVSSVPIRIQLMLLVFIAIIPCMFIILYISYRHHEHIVESSTSDIINLTETISFHHEREVEGLRQLLTALSKVPAIYRIDVASSDAIFKGIIESNPRNLSIGAADRNGIIFAHSDKFSQAVFDVSKRKYFKDAISSGRFSSGEFTIGMITGLPNLHFSMPVLDHRGIITAVLFAAIDQKYFSSMLGSMKLVEGTVLNISDHSGRIIYRNLEHEKYVGLQDTERIRSNLTGEHHNGVFRGTGIDGVIRLYCYRQLRLYDSSEPYLHIRVGIPLDKVYDSARRQAFLSVVLIVVTGFIAIFTGFYIGNFFISGRLSRMAATAEKLGSGDLSSRTGLSYQGAELGILAKTFDDMASSLEKRDSEHIEMEKILKKAKDEVEQSISAKTELIARLESSLAEVKKLTGLIPICSNCKKIRDDDGYWMQVEEYVSNHSGATFSHGICPNCLRKLYPDVAEDIIEKKKLR